MLLKNHVFSVVGGDLRHAHLANSLADLGCKVFGLFFDLDAYISDSVIKTADMEKAFAESDVIILPLPTTLDNTTLNSSMSSEIIKLEELFSSIPCGTCVLGGMITPELSALGAKYGVVITDYFEREEFKILNAIPTAEGAVALAMEELPCTIFERPCAVIGCGRTGRAISRLLHSMGADVFTFARKQSDLAWIRSCGCRAVHLSALPLLADRFDLIINTAPAQLLCEEILTKLKRDCLVIDISSKPGGVDFETAKQLGIRTIWALSLPGKAAPLTAGEIIKDTVINIISELEQQHSSALC